MGRRAKTKQGLSMAQRTAQTMELRAQGYNITEIAQEFGVSANTIWKDCMRALHAWQRLYAEFYQEHTYTTHLRCEALIRHNMTRALEGDASSGLIVQKAIERQAKMFGLDVDTRKTGSDDGDNPFNGITEQERDRELVELFRQALKRKSEAIIEGQIVDQENAE